MNRDYQRISQAIDYLHSHYQQQPSLEELANQLHLSPQHFQRLFSRWAGVSPKRFLQIITVEQAKQRLAQSRPLLEISQDLGLSSASRLYDHFVTLEAVSPGEYQAQGEQLQIDWDCGATPFGPAFIACTPRGICKLSFIDNETEQTQALSELLKQWPRAQLQHNPLLAERWLSKIFPSPAPTSSASFKPLPLHIQGSNFQVQVWRMLLAIQPGAFSSYGDIAQALGKPGGARAVGTAVGRNPVALLIPCHRVIRQSGELGGYRWGLSRKRALQCWELAREEEG